MDGSGEIDREELTKIARIIYNNKFAQELFGLKIDETLFSVEQFVNKFFEEADADGNGSISFEEFKQMAKSNRSRKTQISWRKVSFLGEP